MFWVGFAIVTDRLWFGWVKEALHKMRVLGLFNSDQMNSNEWR